MKKQFKRWIFLASIVSTLAIAQTLPAQEKAGDLLPTVMPVDLAKKAAIKDLLDMIDVPKLIGAIANSAQMQAKQLVPVILSNALTESKSLNDKQKQSAVPILQKTAVPKLLESAGAVFKSEQFRQAAMRAQYEVYSKYYSVSEIKDLIAFYKTPTGRRFITVQDQVSRDLVSGLMQKYMPISIKVTRDQANKEMALLKLK
ncbi:DUF2059 domain-containing protein [Candidatus Vallotia lariciata]|uniref:DUF2059 domain-containing protein n=1 Tax=Candidatus Vallotia laricis TaxID=2018052 RepID=UPI001D033075|nr:DUF2059 domain-containing protein [Candidatus Vallotia lariciata]UDG83216.1 hypothetical protein GKR41_00606 [Candidatus Vallotia lariciata]